MVTSNRHKRRIFVQAVLDAEVAAGSKWTEFRFLEQDRRHAFNGNQRFFSSIQTRQAAQQTKRIGMSGIGIYL